MDAERWERVQALFQAAVDLPPSERSSFLTTAAGGDDQLAGEVHALLVADQHSSPLDQDFAVVAGHLTGSATSLPPPREFGPYRVLHLLGEGGMGIVYLAERPDLKSLAAIKVLRDAWMSPARRERFELEQRTLARLIHPSIARLYDADTLADGTPWFAMEYVKGVPLTEYCGQSRSIEERLNLLKTVCQAVRYAHSIAVIHRDLKPSNILVEADGSVKLLDFGIAKQLDPIDAPANPTLTGLRMMTPAYAAPEQIRGEQPGTYTDVYALGVILFELLTGQVPFVLSNSSPTEADSIILRQQPPRPSALGKKAFPKALWADLDVLCLTALHKDPDRRYGSVDAFIRDIGHYLDGEPLDARPDTVRYRLGKFVQRNRASVTAASLVFACVAGLILFYTLRLRAASNEALAEAARTQRVLRFTLNIFNGGDLQAGPASDLRVTALVDRGVREATNLSSDPAVQAEMYGTLGEVYRKLGVLDRADSLLALALNQNRALFGANNEKVAASLISLALLRSDQARFDDAERLGRQALQISSANLPPGHPAIAAANHALGTVIENRGSYKQAAEFLNEAVRLRSTPGSDKIDLAASQLELANTYFYSSQYTQAEALYRQLLPKYRQFFGDRHPMVAEDLINLGAIQQQRGLYKEAEAFHRQALDIMQSFYGKDHYKTAASLTLVARALEYQSRYDEALELLHRGLSIQEKVFGMVHPNVASTLNELGIIAVKRAHYDEAQAYFTRIVEIYRSCYAGKHYRIGIALANLGGVHMARGDNTGAEQLFRQALAMYAQTLPANSLDEGITRIKLGRALLRQNRPAIARAQTVAGYQIVSPLQSPSSTFLLQAKQDLAAEGAQLK